MSEFLKYLRPISFLSQFSIDREWRDAGFKVVGYKHEEGDDDEEPRSKPIVRKAMIPFRQFIG